MQDHRIDLTPHRPLGSRPTTDMAYEGQHIGHSDACVYDAARYLLDNGLASPEDTVTTYRDGKPSMTGNAEKLKNWTAIDSDKRGLLAARYRPFVDKREAVPAMGIAA